MGVRRALLVLGAALAAAPLAAQTFGYPLTRRVAVVDDHFERKVADPYRWLEADPRKDASVAAWVAEQNAFTRRYLDGLPNRDIVRRAIVRAWDFEKRSPSRVRGNRSFYERNSGLQNQNVIVMRDGRGERVLVDPNALSANGSAVVHDWKPSPDGTKLLFAVQANGGDRRRLHVIDIASGLDSELPLDGIRTPAFDWSADGRTIFYTRYPTTAGDMAAPANSSIYAHRLGTPQSEDARLFDDPSGGELILWPRPTDGRWLIIEFGTTDGSRSDVSAIDLDDRGARPVPLVTGLKASWRYIGSRNGRVYFVTSEGAPRGRVVALDPAGGSKQVPVTVAPSGPGSIQQAVLASEEVIVRSLEGLRSHLHRYGLDVSDRGEIALPPLTVVSALEGRAGQPAIFYSLSSLIMPPTLYRFDLASKASTVVARPKADWNPGNFVLRQVQAKSSDGTMIPVTLAYRKDAGKRPAPTMLMVYGGWGLSVDVAFTETRFAWMQLGGTFAIAHIRGGGELGEEWHRAAIKEGHLKGIEDYAAAARLLQATGVTTPAQTIAYGSSNGGMMAAATINSYPELFGAAIPRVPVTDLVRFTQFTSGRTWIPEMGDPADARELTGLLRWSPLHNIAAGRRYPAVLVNTALGDDRVVPMHSFKYVAALQAADLGPRPRLLRIEQDAGHGEGKAVGQLVDEFTDLWSFAAVQTGLKPRPYTR
ncbi:prolyl oligopeptidase family protein [Novosphingobium sp. Gsoil 351]|uniref:prolyl oligopeptidase family serine peptidase n=1 Tax=Novosphingobium sp. Gsoil 351 TaxID=2675225 RepID=UPI0012B4A455|nr:prolyl oligopeptidase family serine peptidase [Novosphingobium sp. Gsoil 351]QGN55482.1 prolyl oligopeptidase family serine peptidase [Novosphingobium sp. Gsoil 351]